MENYVTGFKYRWFVENCSQIELPNGKVIVIDPIFWKDDSCCRNDMEKKFVSGFDDSVIERCDYILLTHIHFDHTSSLKVLEERFHAPILVNGWSAFELVKHLDLPTGSVIPMSDGIEYNFDDFSVKWKTCRHTEGVGTMHFSEPMPGVIPEEQEYLNFGTVYNSNFVIKLPNGQSIGMDEGRFEPSLSEFEKDHPTLILQHVNREIEATAANVTEELRRSGSPYLFLLTMHIIKEPIAMVNGVNEYLAKKGINGRVVYAKAGQWINFGTGAIIE